MPGKVFLRAAQQIENLRYDEMPVYSWFYELYFLKTGEWPAMPDSAEEAHKILADLDVAEAMASLSMETLNGSMQDVPMACSTPKKPPPFVNMPPAKKPMNVNENMQSSPPSLWKPLNMQWFPWSLSDDSLSDY